MKKSIRNTILSMAMLVLSKGLFAQNESINWLTFEQLEDSLELKPKKVFIDFYAEWCAYCKKMDQVAFKSPDVISKLNSEYYAVKMDAETEDTIVFGGQEFENEDFGKERNAVHEIPKMLASREGMPFSLPAIVVLDRSFRVTDRYFEYLTPKRMLKILDN